MSRGGGLFGIGSDRTVVTENNDVYHVNDVGNGDYRVRAHDSGLGDSHGSKIGDTSTLDDALALIESDSGSDVAKVK